MNKLTNICLTVIGASVVASSGLAIAKKINEKPPTTVSAEHLWHYKALEKDVSQVVTNGNAEIARLHAEELALMKSYSLGPKDKFDTETGEITRAPAEVDGGVKAEPPKAAAKPVAKAMTK